MGSTSSTSTSNVDNKMPSSKPADGSPRQSSHKNVRVKRLPQQETLGLDAAVQNDVPLSTWSPPPTSRQTEKTFTNVLLLGESGVGKSTFINAFVNYLKFDKLELARNGQPITVMPVSFLLTVGNTFDERIVRFGDDDSNEIFDHPGQSVTQQCKSYVFTIGTRTKLRLIDTPGMGDTRGLDQDDLNMQEILSFINNLPHLNAICILLKPNESRLNVGFRSYFSRLIEFLGENVRNNVIFCFTNTRATFFTPGNTALQLRELLANLRIKDIPFKKSNTFCFDSESFRYIVACQNRIDFEESQKQDYEESWVYSVKESMRLLTYICIDLQMNSRTEWKSIDYARFQINQVIRPMLETIRNLFRNLILHDEKSSTKFIELSPIPIYYPSSICIKCKRTLKCCNDFWVYSDQTDIISEKCPQCGSSRHSHIDVNYPLDYKSFDNTNSQYIDEIKKELDQLKEAIITFRNFISNTNQTVHLSSDPILTILNRIISEEKYICVEKQTEDLNSILKEKLDGFHAEYQQRPSKSESNRNSIDLEKIYKQIEKITQMETIRNQMNAIEQYNKTYMVQQEKVLC
ncbi:unnamed protein product [Rotaria socialis]|uniref:G domain-containing protein n=1 Tax=Rotaria socialis TaxID=392032 RepID=A0A820VWV2_9BILA|nr:unnamed protein product [Rotaria socialis]CAF3311092.1 unnamed protein product [Rotaria socialis]CAF3408950.1 unnamed protein product [Rotaria socialis]CAF3435867.1 unnamed protein product [Rotaria socialis]CAF4450838.1 unnamed protein product [Rotaria socialis]